MNPFPKPPRSLVIGFGSIGARHEAVLRELGASTAIVSRHASQAPCPCYSDLHAAIDKFEPDYIVVANRTAEHWGTLVELEGEGFRGRCLVEKPLTAEPVTAEPAFSFDVRVGYVLRFHPLMHAAKDVLAAQRLLSMQIYVGQYLPDWRPGTDYRQSYSAHKGQGGGALRDLSHELDYLLYLAGSWRRVVACGGHYSRLEIDADDVYALLVETELCPIAACQLNYLDRNVRRDCIVQYEGGSVHVDFVSQCLLHNGVARKFAVERNALFAAMHRAAWEPELSDCLCTYAEARDVVALVHAAEQADRTKGWVCHPNP